MEIFSRMGYLILALAWVIGHVVKNVYLVHP